MRPAVRRAIAERLIVVADPLPVGDRFIVFDGKSEPRLSPGHSPTPGSGLMGKAEQLVGVMMQDPVDRGLW